MKIKDFAAKMDTLIPKTLSEVWDHDGVMVMPDGEEEVKKVLCALDCTSVAIEKAASLGCNVIATHHPLLFSPLANLTYDDEIGKRVLACVKNGIAVLSYHTRLDSMEGGVNDKLGERIGLMDPTSFLPYGRIGNVKEQSFDAFCELVKENLQVGTLQCVRCNDTVRRVALVSGNGKIAVADAVRAGADTFLTGECSHEGMIACKEYGINLICATHHATERIVLPFLASLAGDCGADAVVHDFLSKDEYGI